MFTAQQKDVLRRLAGDYMQAATLPVQQQKIDLWKALNRGQMSRPMVCIDQLPWNELQCDELTVINTDPYWQRVELDLRRKLYQWRRFPVDMVLDPAIAIPREISQTGYGLQPSFNQLGTDTTAPATHYNNLLKTMEDVALITDNQVTAHPELDALHMQQAEQLFGDLAPIRLAGLPGPNLGVWDYLTTLMSIDEVMYAFMDTPELLHAAMERGTQSVLAGIRGLDAIDGLDPHSNLCHCSYIYTDELLPGSLQGGAPKAANCWAFGLAQLMTSVSPATFEEFELPYISRMAEQFGMVYYGCCDRMDDRMEIVKRIPHVRKISCSPWSDRRQFAQKIGPQLVMSIKPSPAFLARAEMSDDEITDDLRSYIALAKEYHVNIEFILKDISTVAGRPERLTRWADLAMSLANAW